MEHLLFVTLAQAAGAVAKKESVPGGTLLIVAYLFIWVALFAYLLMLRKTQMRIEREITGLEERLDRHIGELSSRGERP